MYRITHKLLALAVVVTVAALGMWQATGAHPYTKYEDVTREQVRTDVDDAFVEAGFYEGDTVTQIPGPGLRDSARRAIEVASRNTVSMMRPARLSDAAFLRR